MSTNTQLYYGILNKMHQSRDHCISRYKKIIQIIHDIYEIELNGTYQSGSQSNAEMATRIEFNYNRLKLTNLLQKNVMSVDIHDVIANKYQDCNKLLDYLKNYSVVLDNGVKMHDINSMINIIRTNLAVNETLVSLIEKSDEFIHFDNQRYYLSVGTPVGICNNSTVTSCLEVVINDHTQTCMISPVCDCSIPYVIHTSSELPDKWMIDRMSYISFNTSKVFVCDVN